MLNLIIQYSLEYVYLKYCLAKNMQMLDIKTKLVLKILIKECPSGRYKIVDGKDVISSLPQRYKIDLDGLDEVLSYLERQEMISIKYDDEGLYCMSVLPLGYEEGSKSLAKQKREEKSSHFWINLIFTSISSLIAGILGVMLANILHLG